MISPQAHGLGSVIGTADLAKVTFDLVLLESWENLGQGRRRVYAVPAGRMGCQSSDLATTVACLMMSSFDHQDMAKHCLNLMVGDANDLTCPYRVVVEGPRDMQVRGDFPERFQSETGLGCTIFVTTVTCL